MNRLALIVYTMLAAGPGWSQGSIVSTRIYTEPAGSLFRVDGIEYTSSATFLWPVGSKHVVDVRPQQYSATLTQRFNFNSWTDSSNTLNSTNPTLIVTADPAITNIKATVTLEYAFNLSFFQCPGSVGPQPCNGSPGSLIVNGTAYFQDTVLWFPVNTPVPVTAQPNPGFVFQGWQAHLGVPNAFARTIIVQSPVTLSPRFEPAKRVTIRAISWVDGEEISVQILADRQQVLLPATLDWAEGSKHVLAALSPQLDAVGRYWVFDSFDVGTGGLNSIYTAVGTNIPATITARFVPAVRVSFLTQPIGLRLNVDGRDNWASYDFVWGVNTTHPVTAPEEVTDSRGRKYVFKGWSNGGLASQDIAISQEMVQAGLRLIATYELLGRVTLNSTPAGLNLQVDGADCKTPCNVDRPRGGMARVFAPPNISMSETMRMEFGSWSDGASAERVFEFQQDTLTVHASYRTALRLTAVSDPSGASGFKTEPVSTDGFYPEGTNVMVTAEALPGYRFRRWEGDANGTFRSAMVNMSAPKLARAIFDRVPHILPAGIRNAAAELPEPGVTAGSLITILGVNLAPAYEVGPTYPLAQALSGVTARIDNRLLPLLSVSPDRIDAQLPWDLEEGTYRIAVRWSGQPEVVGEFTVVRNAPGLFARGVDGKAVISANHADGSTVSMESPARRGEIITLFGTGFGPLERRPPDGFPVPSAPSYAVTDTVELLAGDLVLTPEWAGAVPGQVGLIGVRLKISDELPGAATLELKARVNGRDSNTVLLPIE